MNTYTVYKSPTKCIFVNFGSEKWWLFKNAFIFCEQKNLVIIHVHVYKHWHVLLNLLLLIFATHEIIVPLVLIVPVSKIWGFFLPKFKLKDIKARIYQFLWPTLESNPCKYIVINGKYDMLINMYMQKYLFKHILQRLYCLQTELNLKNTCMKAK